MKKEFTEISVGTPLLITVSSKGNTMEMSAELVKHLKSNIALVNLANDTGKTLNFDGVDISVVYTSNEGVPYAWFKCKIIAYQGYYLLQVSENGGRRFNRRNSFRVSIAKNAKLRVPGHGTSTVLVGNVSLTGFSVTDRDKLLNLEKGTHVTLIYEDIGHELNLEGNVVRIQEEKDYIIYGFVITKACRDLPSYVTAKQRVNRK